MDAGVCLACAARLPAIIYLCVTVSQLWCDSGTSLRFLWCTLYYSRALRRVPSLMGNCESFACSCVCHSRLQVLKAQTTTVFDHVYYSLWCVVLCYSLQA